MRSDIIRIIIAHMVTMKQVAQAAGVSQPAVSVALSGRRQSAYISAATRRRILAVARKMGYQPNALARAMVTGQTKVIGFLGSTLSNEYTARMLEGAVRVAQAGGYLMKLLHTDSGASEQNALHIAIQQRLAGVISVHADEAFLAKAHAELARHSIPLAILDHTTLNLGSRRAPGIRVLSDDEAGVGAAVRHLAALGHTRIAFLTAVGPMTAWSTREQGYRSAMDRLGLPPQWVYLRGPATNPAECRRLKAQIFRTSNRPTALVCVADHVAMVILRLAREAGRQVPKDLSVVGFADLEMAQYTDPPLTTVAQPFDRMGETVTQRLLAAIERKSKAAGGTQPILLPTRLVVRGSTGPANAADGTRPSGGHSRTKVKCLTLATRKKKRSTG
ncbi:MAG: LacI family DNA-binding transcriptional regulator [Kiritimatiellae bacterium]|nr:LacI family DNA-binding transcriptional regulator [Kiritimatiellia bacterium]